MRGRLWLVADLALRDLPHERRLAICSLVGLAAVLAGRSRLSRRTTRPTA